MLQRHSGDWLVIMASISIVENFHHFQLDWLYRWHLCTHTHFHQLPIVICFNNDKRMTNCFSITNQSIFFHFSISRCPSLRRLRHILISLNRFSVFAARFHSMQTAEFICLDDITVGRICVTKHLRQQTSSFHFRETDSKLNSIGRNSSMFVYRGCVNKVRNYSMRKAENWKWSAMVRVVWRAQQPHNDILISFHFDNRFSNICTNNLYHYLI